MIPAPPELLRRFVRHERPTSDGYMGATATLLASCSNVYVRWLKLENRTLTARVMTEEDAQALVLVLGEMGCINNRVSQANRATGGKHWLVSGQL